MSWPIDLLELIDDTDDLKVAPYREDGATPGTPTWIWCVALDGQLYVRAYSGVASRWYQAALRERLGQIVAAGAVREVSFEPTEPQRLDRIDEAYRRKYRSSRYLAQMVSDRARQATVRISLREGGSAVVIKQKEHQS